jgi:hypothetical protein
VVVVSFAICDWFGVRTHLAEMTEEPIGVDIGIKVLFVTFRSCKRFLGKLYLDEKVAWIDQARMTRAGTDQGSKLNLLAGAMDKWCRLIWLGHWHPLGREPRMDHS